MYNVPESVGVFYNAPKYQYDECYEVQHGWQTVYELTSKQPLNRENEQDTLLDAAEIADSMEEDRGIFKSDNDAEWDDTLRVYCNENECERDIDSDDD
jgi:hypothetical protein